MMNKNGFSRCGENYINRLRKEGRYSTAHVYKNALYSFGKFCGTLNISFRQVTKERLRRYGQYLYDCGLKLHTISRICVCFVVFTLGSESKRLMFPDYFMMILYRCECPAKRKLCLLCKLSNKLLYEDPKSERLRRTQIIADLMFQFCGMSFADLAHLEKSALDQNQCCAII